jgi:hypothetical protein
MKKYKWQILAVIALGLLTWQHFAGKAKDKAIARALSDKQVVQVAERVAKAKAERYLALLAKAMEALTQVKSNETVLAAKGAKLADDLARAQAKANAQALDKDKIKQLNATLTDCRKGVDTLRLDYASQLAARDAAQFALDVVKDDRIKGLETDYAGAIKRMGDMATRIIYLERWQKQKIIIGPVAGYGPTGFFVGVGVMVEIFRLPAWIL